MSVSFAAVYDEMEALAEPARAHRGGQVLGPTDTPWNTRDVTTVDPDGNVVVFTAGRPPVLADPAFARDVIERFRERQPGAPEDPPSDEAGQGRHHPNEDRSAPCAPVFDPPR
jgi:hypothetical protein